MTWPVAAFAACLSPVSAADAARLHGRVAYVTDGDTFRLDDGTRIRIANIDAAETQRGQAKCAREMELGKAATERVRRMIDGRKVSYEVVGKSYRRIVAKVWFGGQDLGARLIADGAAQSWARGKPKPDWCLRRF